MTALPTPNFRLIQDDLRHPASKTFHTLIPDPVSTLETALKAILQHLYTSPDGTDSNTFNAPFRCFNPYIPPTRSVTITLHDFNGVAYTTGFGYEHDKEIHLSLSYVRYRAESESPDAAAREITGVLTHELVHCYQHTTPPGGDSPEDVARLQGVQQPPGGLTEGVADFVRLNADLAPPHWKLPASGRERPPSWDGGYQGTAYFLDWLEKVRIGSGAIGRVNDRLFRVGYTNDDDFWRGLFGLGILDLWEEYGKYLDRA